MPSICDVIGYDSFFFFFFFFFYSLNPAFANRHGRGVMIELQY